MLAAIPLPTFPDIPLGPVTLRTFGLLVALGILAGITLAARHARRRGVAPEEVVSLGTRAVVAGLIGARLAWVLSHLGQIESALDVVAVWKGGLSFTGGFLLAVPVVVWSMRGWERERRWIVADGMGLGLVVGLAFGRVGCIAVGEHLGGPTSFVLGWRYLGGSTREGPLEVGVTYHNTSIYELLHLLVLAGVLWWLLERVRVRPGVAIGVFALWYGALRFLTDFLRDYDRTVLGLTGAQWACLALLPAGIWVLLRARGPADGGPSVPAAEGAGGRRLGGTT